MSEKLVIVVGVVALIAIILIIVFLGRGPTTPSTPSASSISSAASQALGGTWVVNTSKSVVAEINATNSSASATYLNGTKTVTSLPGPLQITFGSTTLNLGYPLTVYVFYLENPTNGYTVLIGILRYPNSTVPTDAISTIQGQSGLTPNVSSGLSYFAISLYGQTELVGSNGDFLVMIMGNYPASPQAYAALANRVLSLVGGP